MLTREKKLIWRPIWMKLVMLMQNNMPILVMWSKSKLEVEFQYSGRTLAFANSYISAVDWDMSTKFSLRIEFDIVKTVTSINKRLQRIARPASCSGPRCCSHAWNTSRTWSVSMTTALQCLRKGRWLFSTFDDVNKRYFVLIWWFLYPKYFTTEYFLRMTTAYTNNVLVRYHKKHALRSVIF